MTNTMAMLWQCYDNVMTMLWQCCDNVMTMLWQSWGHLDYHHDYYDDNDADDDEEGDVCRCYTRQLWRKKDLSRVRPGPKRLIVLTTTNKQSPEQKQTNSNIKIYQNIATVVPFNCSAKIIISDQSYQTKAFIKSNLGSLYLTWIILFQSHDQLWVRHITFIIPSFQTLSAYSQLLTPSLSLRELDACAGHIPPAEPERIQHPVPSMSSPILQVILPVLTDK